MDETMADKAIDDLMLENRKFPPSADFRKRALLSDSSMYDEAGRDYQSFWAKQATELITWAKPWQTVCEWELPFSKWFVGGELNVSYNCIDRHVQIGRAHV